jgi:hypothetical protein
MKIETPLHADHQLDQLAGQFEHGRQNRTSPRERIPQTLWKQAAALTTMFPYTRVATRLRLSAKDLKASMAAEPETHVGSGPTTASFVEVPLAPLGCPVLGRLAVELHRRDGARLCMHSPNVSLPLTASIQSFLAAR